MRVLVVGLSAILVLAVGFAYLNSGNGLSSLRELFMSQPQSQKIVFGVIGLTVALMLALALWQSERLLQQTNAIRQLNSRIDGVRQTVQTLDESQKSAEMAVDHLVGSDPEDAIVSLQKRLAEAERVTLLQHSRNEAVDMESRVEAIREWQQALKTQLGDVVGKRRSVEPIFAELKERQRILERGLLDFEIDKDGNDLETRLGELTDFVKRTQSRFEGVDRALETLGQLKTEFGVLRTRLVPLKAPEGGVKNLIDEVRTLRDQIAADLDGLERDGESKLSDRIQEFADKKRELEERVSIVTEQFANLEMIRRDIGTLFTKLSGTLNEHAVSKT